MDKVNKRSWQGNADVAAQALCVVLAFIIPISTFLTTVCMLLIVLIWLTMGDFKNKMHYYFKHPLTGSILLFIGISCLGFIHAKHGAEAFATIADYIRLAYIPILMFYLRSKTLQRYVMQAFVAAMLLTLILGYLKVYAHLPIGSKFTMGAVFKNHIKTSYLMAIAAFILSVHGYQTPKHRWWVGAVILVMLHYLFFMSFGRIGHLTIFLLALVWGWYFWRLKGIFTTVLVLTVFLTSAYLTSDVFANRINVLQQDWASYHEGGQAVASSSMGARAMFYKISSLIFLEHPLIGVGTGSFKQAYTDYVGQDTLLLTDNPHNQYLKVMVESGIIGLLALLFLLYRTWQLSTLRNNMDRFLIQGILLSFYAGCLLNSWLSDFVESYFFILFCATAFASISIKETRAIKNIEPLLGTIK